MLADIVTTREFYQWSGKDQVFMMNIVLGFYVGGPDIRTLSFPSSNQCVLI